MTNSTRPYAQLLLQSIPSPDPDVTWNQLAPPFARPPAGSPAATAVY